MLYKQLRRVNDLDTQISDIHRRLANLYAERALLLSKQTVEDKPQTVSIPEEQVKNTYNGLSIAWSRPGVKLPAHKSLMQKIKRALEIVYELEQNNTQLVGQLEIIAVPPYKTLHKLLSDPEQLIKYEFEFANADLLTNLKKSQGWTVIVLVSPQSNLRIENLKNSWGRKEFRFKDYDCQALGVQEFLAALFQNPSMVAENQWTLLLKDSTAVDYVPCVIKSDYKIIFDIDDANSLLGDNYLQSAIKA